MHNIFDAIEHALDWDMYALPGRTTEAAWMACAHLGPNAPPGLDVKYSADDFKQAHADFPQVLEHMFRTSASADALRHAARFARGDYVSFVNAQGAIPPAYDSFAVESFVHIGYHPERPAKNAVSLVVNTYVLQRTTSGILYSRTLDKAYPVRTTDYMEQHFPGWMERYQIGTSLGLDAESMVRHVLQHQVPCPVATLAPHGVDDYGI